MNLSTTVSTCGNRSFWNVHFGTYMSVVYERFDNINDHKDNNDDDNYSY